MKAEELVASRSLREAGYVWRVASGEWRAAPRTQGTQQSEAVPLVALAEGGAGRLALAFRETKSCCDCVGG